MNIARFLILGLGVIGATAALAQVPKANQPMSAALRTFSKAYPQCAGWTDWRQFCSRTGPNGEDYCLTDPAMPVKPSAVFCAAWEEDSQIATLTRAQRRSAKRYTIGAKFSPVKYDRDRPFANNRLAARNHPWCKSWLTEVMDPPLPKRCWKDVFQAEEKCKGWSGKGDQENICLKGTAKNSKVCEVEVEPNFMTPTIFYGCTEWDVPQWCEIASSMQNKSEYPPEGEISLGIETFAANGTICLKRATK
jgi:hypothetical protein